MQGAVNHVIGLCVLLAGLARMQAQIASEPCGPLVKLSSGVMRTQLIHEVTPQYGAVVRETGVNGAVFFRAIVGCDGHVQSVTVISGPKALQPAIVEAVKQWIYRPYFLNGRAVPVDLTMGITMDLGADAIVEVLPSGREHVASGIMAGRILSQTPPLQFLPGTKMSGATILNAVIGRDGRVLELTPISGPEILRGPVMDSVRQWRYMPFLLNGDPVEIETTIVVRVDSGGL